MSDATKTDDTANIVSSSQSSVSPSSSAARLPPQSEPDAEEQELAEQLGFIQRHMRLVRFLAWIGAESFGGNLVKAILTIVVLGGTLFFIWLGPNHYTPPVQVLFAAVLFLLAFWIGTGVESAKVRRQANDKWLPHAEAVIYRLMTLYANVATLGIKTRKSCSCACCELPELKDDKMRAVRVRLKAECEASADRLDDISNQLEDAVEDWRRFISENCYGDECGRIFEGLQQRRNRIAEELSKAKEAAQKTEHDPGCGSA